MGERNGAAGGILGLCDTEKGEMVSRMNQHYKQVRHLRASGPFPPHTSARCPHFFVAQHGKERAGTHLKMG